MRGIEPRLPSALIRCIGFSHLPCTIPIKTKFRMCGPSKFAASRVRPQSRLSLGSVAIGADTNHASTPGLGLHISSSAPCNLFARPSCGDQEEISANSYSASTYARWNCYSNDNLAVMAFRICFRARRIKHSSCHANNNFKFKERSGFVSPLSAKPHAIRQGFLSAAKATETNSRHATPLRQRFSQKSFSRQLCRRRGSNHSDTPSINGGCRK